MAAATMDFVCYLVHCLRDSTRIDRCEERSLFRKIAGERAFWKDNLLIRLHAPERREDFVRVGGDVLPNAQLDHVNLHRTLLPHAVVFMHTIDVLVSACAPWKVSACAHLACGPVPDRNDCRRRSFALAAYLKLFEVPGDW